MKHFTSKDVKKIFPHSVERTYPSGQIVIYIGDQPSHVFFIKKGALKNYDIDDNGSENILTIIGEGGFFSILFTLGEKPEVSSFYSTLDETELLLIPIEDFKAKLKTDIMFTNNVFKWFASEILLLMDRIKGLEKTEGKMKV
ncbi:MAG: cyclic nucleotide-binding domain-containing protein, partial [Methylophilus sp.]